MRSRRSPPTPMPDIHTLVDVDAGTDRIVVTPKRRSGDAWETSLLVVVAVAVVEDTDPERLPPLYDSVDPEALDTLLASAGEEAGLTVRFEYAGYEVRLDSNARVELRRRE